MGTQRRHRITARRNGSAAFESYVPRRPWRARARPLRTGRSTGVRQWRARRLIKNASAAQAVHRPVARAVSHAEFSRDAHDPSRRKKHNDSERAFPGFCIPSRGGCCPVRRAFEVAPYLGFAAACKRSRRRHDVRFPIFHRCAPKQQRLSGAVVISLRSLRRPGVQQYLCAPIAPLPRPRTTSSQIVRSRGSPRFTPCVTRRPVCHQLPADAISRQK